MYLAAIKSGDHQSHYDTINVYTKFHAGPIYSCADMLFQSDQNDVPIEAPVE